MGFVYQASLTAASCTVLIYLVSICVLRKDPN